MGIILPNLETFLLTALPLPGFIDQKWVRLATLIGDRLIGNHEQAENQEALAKLCPSVLNAVDGFAGALGDVCETGHRGCMPEANGTVTHFIFYRDGDDDDDEPYASMVLLDLAELFERILLKTISAGASASCRVAEAIMVAVAKGGIPVNM